MRQECTKPRRRRMFGHDLCNRCGLPGHVHRDCSLSWRRYSFAREPTRREVGRAANLLTPQCYNCAAPLHYGDECPTRRRGVEWSIFHSPNWEFLQQAALSPQASSAGTSPKRRYEEVQSQHPPQGKGRARDEREARHQARDRERDRVDSHSRDRSFTLARELGHRPRNTPSPHLTRHRPPSHAPPLARSVGRREETVYRRNGPPDACDPSEDSCSHQHHPGGQGSGPHRGELSRGPRSHKQRSGPNPRPGQAQQRTSASVSGHARRRP